MTSPRGTPGEVNQDMILGEMRGQLREVVHSLNNLTQKFDVLSKEVVGLALIGTEMLSLKATVTKLESDVSLLEQERHRRDGATTIVATVLKSPTLAWLVGIVVLGFGIIKGWVKIQ